VLIWHRLPLRSGLFDEEPHAVQVHWQPDLDIFELPDRFLLAFALPGVGAADVEVTVLGRTLVVSGERRLDIPRGALAHRIESSRGRFERSVRLPAGSDLSGIRTEIAEGQLLISIHRTDPESPRRVPIRTGDRP
jgi:HSP20 family protein